MKPLDPFLMSEVMIYILLVGGGFGNFVGTL